MNWILEYSAERLGGEDKRQSRLSQVVGPTSIRLCFFGIKSRRACGTLVLCLKNC